MSTDKPTIPLDLVYAISGPVLSLNPDGPGQNSLPCISTWPACYESLVDFTWPRTKAEARAALADGGDTATVRPALAESWETSSDGKIWRFNLRRGVKSSLGNELTAADVVWSMEKAFAGKATTAFILAFIGGVTSADAVRAIDASTVEFSLGVPEERILLALGWGWPVVYDSSEVRRQATADDPYANEWLHTHAAGFGPYALAAYSQAGREVVLEAHSSYWGPPPAVGRVTLRTIDDSSERLRLLLDGTVHYAPDLTPVELDAVERSERAHIVHIDGTPGAFISLTYAAPWGDRRVRQAIARAISSEEIIETVLHGRAEPYRSVLVPLVPGVTDAAWQYSTDLEAAREVLSTIGEPLTLSYSTGLPIDEQIAVLVKGWLEQAGLAVRLELLPRGEFDQRKYSRTDDLQAFVTTVDSAGIAAADFFFHLYGSKNGWLNFNNYDNPRLEQVIAECRSPEPAVRDAAIREGQEILMEDLLFHPLAWTGKDHAIASFLTIRGGHTASGQVWWQDVTLA